MITLRTNFLMAVIFVAAGPFLSGLITKVKNDMRLRQGQSLWQPYYNFTKLFGKGEVVSETASWIFTLAPLIVLASTLTAVFFMTEFLALIFIFALGRFFLSLAALDTGSAFGGMGSSREMFISSLVEPVACVAGFALTLHHGSTNFVSPGLHFSAATLLAGLSFFMVTLAETSRLPVDNQETHLELTMVHEAMILEYSGRRLALIELSAQLKQMIWLVITAQVLFPLSSLSGATAWYAVPVKVIFIAVGIAVLEVMVAKIRLLRVVDFLGFAFILGALAMVCAIAGY